jgi:RNA polymerase-binding transcription factor DksA
MTPTTDAENLHSAVAAAAREHLLRDRAELLSHLDAASVPPPQATATTGQGETEHVTSEVEYRVQAVLDASVLARLAELDGALQRIDDGTYGRCVRCGSTIGRDRLEAIPHAALCVRCQEADDDRRRARRPR